MTAVFDTAAIELHAPAAWRTAILDGVRTGGRPLTLYGRRDGDHVLVTAALRTAAGRIEVVRTVVEPAVGYHELTSTLPELHCFERELHEQYDVRIAGHPWLKPIRYAGRDQAAMNDYPFYRIDGKEVHEVAVGPIHAGVIEPGSFRFACFGEHVLHLEIHLGYQHRGVEALLLAHEPRALVPWVETIAGDTTIGHAWAYCAAIEALCGVAIDPDIARARSVALELERIAMHLATLSGLAADVGFLPGGSTYGRLRTTAINTTMRLCGSRFGRGALKPGGNGVRLDAALADVVRENLALLATDVAIIDECFLSARTVKHRLAGVGVLSTELARQLGVVGPIARSSGVALDARAYPVDACLEDAGDCWARARIRIAEIGASLRYLETVMSGDPAWQPQRAALPALAPSRLAIAVVEGWRGEIVHALETDASGALVHYKVQDPSLRNWMGLAVAVRGNEISDFPICNKSFDLSYCGNDL